MLAFSLVFFFFLILLLRTQKLTSSVKKNKRKSRSWIHAQQVWHGEVFWGQWL